MAAASRGFSLARTGMLLHRRRSWKLQQSTASLLHCRCSGTSAVPMQRAAVLYHYPCPDGVFAALAAHLYHKAIGCPAVFYPNTVYNPLSVQDIDLQNVDVVYLLDFAGPKGFAVELAHCAKEVIILDHHKTALESLPNKGDGPPNLQCLLDMNRSGATISYDYFRDKLFKSSCENGLSNCELSGICSAKSLVLDTDKGRIEKLFRYIEDADLWRWRLPDSKAFSSGINDLGIDFSARVNPGVFDRLLGLDPEQVIAHGKESLRGKQQLIDQALQTAFQVKLGQGKFGECLAVRADSIAHLRSELGNQLAEKSSTVGLLPIGAVVYSEPALEDNRFLKISLRSVSDFADTTVISQAYGGGGHQKASSFLLTKEEFQRWML